MNTSMWCHVLLVQSNEHLPTHKPLATKYANNTYVLTQNLSFHQEISGKHKHSKAARPRVLQGWCDLPLEQKNQKSTIAH